MAKVDMTASDAVRELVRKDTVDISGERKVEVRICKVKDIPQFMNLVANLYTDLGLSGNLQNPALIEEQVKAIFSDGSRVLKLISQNVAEVFDVVGRLTSLTKEEVEDLDPDDAAIIVKRLVEINYGFFTARVLPLLPGLLAERLQGKVATAKD